MAGARRIVVEFLGDGHGLTNTLGDIEGRTSKFGSVMGKVGKAAFLGLAAGAAVAVAAGGKFAQMAVEDSQAADLLAGALERNAKASPKQVAAVEDWITAIGRAKGVADDDLRPALGRLVTATHDVQKAQVLAQVAMDVSAATGKSLESVSTALMKAQNGQVSSLSRLGINTKNAAGETITMEQAVASMSATFGGAASEKANTLQGKMDRLKLILSETGEAIGYKLIPVLTTMAEWFVNKAMPAISDFAGVIEARVMPKLRELGEWIETTVVPAVKDFVNGFRDGEGAGGKFRDALDKVWSVLQPLGEFIINNKTVVATFAGVILTVVAAVKVWTAVQTVLNVVLTANPIGLVVVALAALAAGMVYAYKNSETFRKVVDTALDGVQAAFKFMWNNVVQPVLSFFIKGLADAMDMVGGLFDALGNVPGFGWAKDLGDKMHGAADQARGLADNIRKIPDKTVHIDVVVNTSAIDKAQHQMDVLGGIRGRGGSAGMGAGKNTDEWGGNAGATLIANIVRGIKKHKVELNSALEQVTAFIAQKMEKLQTLLDKREAIISSFKGMASSIFSTDLSVGEGETPKTVQALLDAGKANRNGAEGLLADVKSLIGKGLSSDLLRSLVESGSSGMEQIHLLATATEDQIAQANADNLATQQALQAAGMEASRALGIEADIRATERDIRLAETIQTKMQELLDKQDKNTIVELHLDGHKILWSLKKIKRQNGGHLGLGDSDRE